MRFWQTFDRDTPPGPFDTMNVIVVELLTVEALLPLFMAVSAMIDGRANLKSWEQHRETIRKKKNNKRINVSRGLKIRSRLRYGFFFKHVSGIIIFIFFSFARNTTTCTLRFSRYDRVYLFFFEQHSKIVTVQYCKYVVRA